jgi:hypothetical protein
LAESVISAVQLPLYLSQLLLYLLKRTRNIGPVEADRCGALLQPSGHEQRGQGGYEATEDVTPALPTFDTFPRLSVAQLEQMRVAPAHLGLQLLDHVRRGELLALLTEHQLEGEMEEQIAELSPDVVDIAVA